MSNKISRRAFLKVTGVSALALGAASMLGGCQSSSGANTAPYFHALSASTTDFTVTVDGQAAEAGAYVSLYDAATESFSDVPSLPPQGTGYIELVCMVPAGWQQMTVTYNPTFASGKSITFVMSASDLKNS